MMKEAEGGGDGATTATTPVPYDPTTGDCLTPPRVHHPHAVAAPADDHVDERPAAAAPVLGGAAVTQAVDKLLHGVTKNLAIF